MKLINSKEHKIFLQQLYQLRVSAGFTQSDLADKLKVPQSFISKMENGERRLDLLELRLICKAMNSDIIEFAIQLEKKIYESRRKV